MIKWSNWSNDQIDQMNKLIKWSNWSNDQIDQMVKLTKWSNESKDQSDNNINWINNILLQISSLTLIFIFEKDPCTCMGAQSQNVGFQAIYLCSFNFCTKVDNNNNI